MVTVTIGLGGGWVEAVYREVSELGLSMRGCEVGVWILLICSLYSFFSSFLSSSFPPRLLSLMQTATVHLLTLDPCPTHSQGSGSTKRPPRDVAARWDAGSIGNHVCHHPSHALDEVFAVAAPLHGDCEPTS